MIRSFPCNLDNLRFEAFLCHFAKFFAIHVDLLYFKTVSISFYAYDAFGRVIEEEYIEKTYSNDHIILFQGGVFL